MSRSRRSSLVLSLVLLLAGCGSVPDVVGSRPSPAVGLDRVEWQLVEVRDGSEAWPVQQLDSVLRFDGRGGWSTQACNYSEGTSRSGDGWVELDWQSSTAMGCDGDAGRLQREVGTVLEGRVEVDLTDGVLRLGPSGGPQLVYRERASIYPTTSGRTVAQGERGQAQYRVALHSGGPVPSMSMEARPAPGTVWDLTGFGAPEPALEPGIWTSGALEVDGEQLLAGFAPAGTVRLTHRAAPDDPVLTELEVQQTDDTPWVVWHGFVEAHDADSRFEASAEDGSLLKAW